LFDNQDKQSQWSPLAEIMNFKKITFVFLLFVSII
jgi:hypothetical protein